MMASENIQVVSPAARYQADLASGVLLPDPAQAAAIARIEILFQQLVRDHDTQSARGVRAALRRVLARRRVSARDDGIKGIYFYGGVGRGKTYIMDLFYESLPFVSKQRTHFHRFMQSVHARLSQLKQQKNPLEVVAAELADRAHVLCFDEFFVSDIGDAMILGALLEHLMKRGVVLVATSNIHPDGLYENGLQRQRFLPAIALLHAHTEVFHLDGGVDYRLRALRQACLYFSPLGAAADLSVEQSFVRLIPEHAQVVREGAVSLLDRSVPARALADDVIWFDFGILCGGNRSAFDYIELARIYHAVILSDVPQMDAAQDDVARRFVSLIDELYDRHVKLIISAAVPLTELYCGHNLAFVFERTQSRLLEMQSEEYLALEHRP
jgi:cell division protein ZapE